MQQAGSIGLHLLAQFIENASVPGRSVLTVWADAPICEMGPSRREPSTYPRHHRFTAFWIDVVRQLLLQAGR